MAKFNISEQQKSILKCMGVIFFVVAILAVVYINKTLFRPKGIEYYKSSVAQSDCLLCGIPNDYRGADMLSFIKLNNNSFDISNVGLKGYCRLDDGEIWEPFDVCDTLMYKDESLSESELQHKYAPYNINGIYRLHADWERSMEMFASPFDTHGTTGTIHRYEANQFVYGRLDMGQNCHADADYLTSILCQSCIEKVYPATRNINCFFYDCQTGTVYPLLGGESEYDVRNYSVDLVYRSNSNIVFVIKYKEPEWKN